MTTKIERRVKIKYRVRNKISGTTECPRMSVFRSNKQIYVQIIDDLSGKTLAAASSLGMTEKMPKKEQAAKVGELIAKKAQEAGITTVVFDRNGYLYHGRVKEVADAARLSQIDFGYCGATIESLIIKTGWVACFYLATAKVISPPICTPFVTAKRQSRRKCRQLQGF